GGLASPGARRTERAFRRAVAARVVERRRGRGGIGQDPPATRVDAGRSLLRRALRPWPALRARRQAGRSPVAFETGPRTQPLARDALPGRAHLPGTGTSGEGHETPAKSHPARPALRRGPVQPGLYLLAIEPYVGGPRTFPPRL